MKTSKSFFHTFDHEEIAKDCFITGKYSVTYDWEDNQVYDVYINVGDDMIYNPITLDQELPYHRGGVYQACQNHLEEQ